MKLKIIKKISVQSTNNEAIKLIKKNKFKSSLITSRIQTNGKGTMGKKWISKKGNLFFSIFFVINQKKINFKQYAILNAYFFKKIISNFSTKQIKIKWPNDLLIDKKKVCGILQEVITFNNKDFLIVGVGINTNNCPIIKNYKTTCLKSDENQKINNSEILNEIIKKYDKFIDKTKANSFKILKKNLLK
jgi:BirA family biotin operon repressor/biotin-[acetyl-CoA-carboxylase] ligase